MLTIDQIASYFPDSVFRKNPQGALVEYLQCEILDSLFKNQGAEHLSFIGGTAIRIQYQSLRFSEDLDFDNFALSFDAFESLLENTCRDMEYKGFDIEFRTVEKEAFHCYIRFPGMLYKSGISPDKGRKILIRIDSESKGKNYTPQVTVLNRYGVFRRMLAAPVEILLAQKMMAILYRRPPKGRDLFDVSFLMGLTTPDFIYIEQVLGLDRKAFLKKFIDRTDALDLNFLAKDVEPFLFSADQRERVLSFRSQVKIGDSH
jgi:predicted nucleotidyltransferase component of viral defense system